MSPLVVALIVAASPFAVIPAVLLLLAHDPRRTAGAFLIGWFAGVLLLVLLAIVMADLVEAWQAPEWSVWIRGAVGAVLILLGLRSILVRSPSGSGGWAARLAGITAPRAAGLGALLAAANPKVVALVAAGGLAIGQSGATVLDEAVQALLFAAVASLGVALPLAVHVGAGHRADRWLRGTEAWLDRRGDQVMGAVLLLVGAFLIANVLR